MPLPGIVGRFEHQCHGLVARLGYEAEAADRAAAVGDDEALARLGEGDALYSVEAERAADSLAAANIPQANRAVQPARGQPVAVGRKRDARQPAIVAAESVQLPAAGQVPNDGQPVAAG